MQNIHPSVFIPIFRLAFRENHAVAIILDPLPTSLDEACRRLPGGAYTTLRTYNRTSTFRLEDHFDRLEESASLTGIPVKLPRAELRQALRQLITHEPQASDTRIRIVLDLESSPGDLYLVRSPLHTPPPEAYLNGVKAILTPLQRTQPAAKLTAFIQRAAEVRLPPGVNEALMVDPAGRILEGLSSNFYAVLEGMLWTAGEGVLEGITRRLVLEEAREDGLEVCLEATAVADIPRYQEAFITSTSRAVLPVTQIDEQVVGSGKAGPAARRLLELYQTRIEREFEEI